MTMHLAAYQTLRSLLMAASCDQSVDETLRETITSALDVVTEIIQGIQEPSAPITTPVAPKLSAAAPDLLEAVKLLQAALSEYRLLNVRKRFSLSLAHAAAGAAIAKAEGR